MPIGIPTEVKTEIQTYPATAEARISKCSIKLKSVQTFFVLLNHSVFYFDISLKQNKFTIISQFS